MQEQRNRLLARQRARQAKAQKADAEEKAKEATPVASVPATDQADRAEKVAQRKARRAQKKKEVMVQREAREAKLQELKRGDDQPKEESVSKHIRMVRSRASIEARLNLERQKRARLKREEEKLLEQDARIRQDVEMKLQTTLVKTSQQFWQPPLLPDASDETSGSMSPAEDAEYARAQQLFSRSQKNGFHTIADLKDLQRSRRLKPPTERNRRISQEIGCWHRDYAILTQEIARRAHSVRAFTRYRLHGEVEFTLNADHFMLGQLSGDYMEGMKEIYLDYLKLLQHNSSDQETDFDDNAGTFLDVRAQHMPRIDPTRVDKMGLKNANRLHSMLERARFVAQHTNEQLMGSQALSVQIALRKISHAPLSTQKAIFITFPLAAPLAELQKCASRLRDTWEIYTTDFGRHQRSVNYKARQIYIGLLTMLKQAVRLLKIFRQDALKIRLQGEEGDDLTASASDQTISTKIMGLSKALKREQRLTEPIDSAWLSILLHWVSTRSILDLHKRTPLPSRSLLREEASARYDSPTTKARRVRAVAKAANKKFQNIGLARQRALQQRPSTQTSGRSLSSSHNSERVSRPTTVNQTDISGPDEIPARKPLSFQIPRDILAEALKRRDDAEPTYWSLKLYQDPSGDRVRIHYCKSRDQAESAAQLFVGKPVVGFDIEWVQGSASKISLIQLACEERVALFHLAFHRSNDPSDVIAPSLRSILESPDTIKTGVAIKGDCTRLENAFGIKSQGLLELSHLYKLVKYWNTDSLRLDKRGVQLASQVKEHLLLPLYKGDVRVSDWSKSLTYDQCQYAADDAYASFRVEDVLERKRLMMDPRPPRPAFAELQLPIPVPRRVPRRIRKQLLAASKEQDYKELVTGPSEQTSSAYSIEGFDQRKTSGPAPDQVQDNNLIGRLGSWLLGAKGNHQAPAGSVDHTKQTAVVETTAQKSSSKTTSDLRNGDHMNNQKDLHQSDDNAATADQHKSLLIAQANEWVTQHQSSFGKSRRLKGASSSQLRAYYLWHIKGLDVEVIAQLLRSPPLQTTTIATYIMESVRLNGLVFRLSRLESVHEKLPRQARLLYGRLMGRIP